jgi:hypothetical protein
MRAPLTAVAALAAAALGSGCADPARGTLDVTWTFAGQSCLAAGVHTIQVDLANELLNPNQFSCDLGGGSIAGGAHLLGSFLAGPYTLTVSGLDANGTVLYQTQQDIAIQRGSNVVQIDAQPVPAGSISLDWTFGGLSCAGAGVSSVRMSVDGQFITDQSGSVDVACTAAGVDGTSISPLAPGTHVLYLVGVRGGQPVYWQQNLKVKVVSGADTNVRVDLPPGQPTSGIADVSWDALASGGGFALGAQGAMTCAEAQVDVVTLALDPNPDGTGGTPLAPLACNNNGVEGTLISTGIPAGPHTFAMSGLRNTIGGSTLVYQTTHPASAQFVLGLVSNVDVDADPVGSAIGSAVLSWDFGGAACPGSVSYTLTAPSGTKQSGTAPCSGLSLPNVASGLWGFDATAGAFQTSILFAVPNQSSASWQIPFSG